jgi:hypothetical protein
VLVSLSHADCSLKLQYLLFPKLASDPRCRSIRSGPPDRTGSDIGGGAFFQL